ncbi:MAG: hypothetical protein HY660_06975 [Armatimonadetes bacterium]|nr:hypothetical protein [Armatimonadota bacterium]
MPELLTHLVPVIDADPEGYNQVIAGTRDARDVADFESYRAQVAAALDVLYTAARGEGAITIHTSPTYRTLFLEEPYLGLWRDAAARGVELLVHPHEDLPGGSVLVHDAAHMREVIQATCRRLRDAGLPPAGYRGGYFGFDTHLVATLEEAGLAVDFSSALGIANPARAVEWPADFLTAQPLCPRDYRHAACDHPRSRVLSVPLGWDGEVASLDGHSLFNERATMDELRRAWRAVAARAHRSGQPQAVNFLFHSGYMLDARWRDQAAAFIGEVIEGGAAVVRPTRVPGAGSRAG